MDEIFEKPLEKLQAREITFLQFLEEVNCDKQFKKWCEEHYLIPDEGAAQLYFDYYGFEDTAIVKEFIEPRL